MKVCEVLIGPIQGNKEILYQEGEEITLETATAEQFERQAFVRIIGDALDSSAVAGKAAEPTPVEPAAESPLPGGDFKEDELPPIYIGDSEPEEPVVVVRKRRAAASED